MIDGAAPVLVAGAEEKLPLLSQMQDMGGIFQGGVNVMGDHDDRDPRFFVDMRDLRIQCARSDRIQTRDRLIQQDQLLGGAQRPRQQHALLLPA